MKKVNSKIFAKFKSQALSEETMGHVLGASAKPGPWHDTSNGGDSARINQHVSGGIELDHPIRR